MKIIEIMNIDVLFGGGYYTSLIVFFSFLFPFRGMLHE